MKVIISYCVAIIFLGWLLYCLATPVKTEGQFSGIPTWQTMTISGHRYIIVKYKDSAGITHDESCEK